MSFRLPSKPAAVPRPGSSTSRTCLPSRSKTRTTRVGVLQVDGQEMVAHDVDALERLGRLGDQLVPVLGLGRAGVDRDDLAPRGVLVGLEPEDRAVVVDERVLGVELADEVDRLCVGSVERPVEDAILGVGPFRDGEDQVLAVVGDVGAARQSLCSGSSQTSASSACGVPSRW